MAMKMVRDLTNSILDLVWHQSRDWRVTWSQVKQHYLPDNHRITGPPCGTWDRTTETALLRGNEISLGR